MVAGGGLSGCDAALELADQGHEVTIVEMADDLARGLIRFRARRPNAFDRALGRPTNR